MAPDESWWYAPPRPGSWTIAPRDLPTFAERWFAGDYPSGRGQQRPVMGWCCSGCGRGYAPHVRECAHCGPKTEQATSTNCCGPNGCEDAER